MHFHIHVQANFFKIVKIYVA